MALGTSGPPWSLNPDNWNLCSFLSSSSSSTAWPVLPPTYEVPDGYSLVRVADEPGLYHDLFNQVTPPGDTPSTGRCLSDNWSLLLQVFLLCTRCKTRYTCNPPLILRSTPRLPAPVDERLCAGLADFVLLRDSAGSLWYDCCICDRPLPRWNKRPVKVASRVNGYVCPFGECIPTFPVSVDVNPTPLGRFVCGWEKELVA